VWNRIRKGTQYSAKDDGGRGGGPPGQPPALSAPRHEENWSQDKQTERLNGRGERAQGRRQSPFIPMRREQRRKNAGGEQRQRPAIRGGLDPVPIHDEEEQGDPSPPQLIGQEQRRDRTANRDEDDGLQVCHLSDGCHQRGGVGQPPKMLRHAERAQVPGADGSRDGRVVGVVSEFAHELPVTPARASRPDTASHQDKVDRQDFDSPGRTATASCPGAAGHGLRRQSLFRFTAHCPLSLSRTARAAAGKPGATLPA